MDSDREKGISAASPRRSSMVLRAVALALITTMAYLPALAGPFFSDDLTMIVHNPLIKAKDGCWRFWATTQEVDYWPMVYTSFWIEWRLWGPNPIGYHLANLLLHLAAACLVWRILFQLRIPGAWCVGLLFALHPANVETVAWIAERKNLFATVFALAALSGFLRYLDDRHLGGYASSWVWYVLAMLSKTSVVTWPVVMAGCVWWRSAEYRDRPPVDRWKNRQGRALAATVPFFLVALSLGLVAVWFQRHHALSGEVFSPRDPWRRIADAGWILWFYAKLVFFPFGQSFLYGPRPTHWLLLPFYSIGWSILLVAAWWGRRSWGRPVLASFGYFAVCLFPVLGFTDIAFFSKSLVADRWVYLALPGLLALPVGLAAANANRGGPWGKRAWQGTFLVVVVGAFYLTWLRAPLFADERALWEDAVNARPELAEAYNGLAAIVAQQDQTELALEYVETALRHDPGNFTARRNYGVILSRQGNYDAALVALRQAQELAPDSGEPWLDLAHVYQAAGQVDEARRAVEQSLRKRPTWSAHLLLGDLHYDQGDFKEAERQYRASLALRPVTAATNLRLARTLAVTQRSEAALAAVEEALWFAPEWSEALIEKGRILDQLGKSSAADDAYTAAIRSALATGDLEQLNHIERILEARKRATKP